MHDFPELRTQVARVLQGRTGDIVTGALGVFPFAGIEHLGPADRQRLGEIAVQLLTTAVRDGELDADFPVAAALGRFAAAHAVSLRLLFTVLHLMERAALDELAQDESFGVESEPWPILTQMMHRASLDVCATVSGHVGSNGSRIVDPLTTLHTKAVFMAALDKEIQRAERFGYPFAVIVLAVDDLGGHTAGHGQGAGDRVIERTAIVVRNYFRETDWVGRLGEDRFGVIMPDIQAFNAERLAERIRVTVQERLRLHDHRSGEAYAVTVSVGVLAIASADRAMKPDALLAAAEDAASRASAAGGNRVVSQRLDS